MCGAIYFKKMNQKVLTYVCFFCIFTSRFIDLLFSKDYILLKLTRIECIYNAQISRLLLEISVYVLGGFLQNFYSSLASPHKPYNHINNNIQTYFLYFIKNTFKLVTKRNMKTLFFNFNCFNF